jgi:hypothetical protein
MSYSCLLPFNTEQEKQNKKGFGIQRAIVEETPPEAAKLKP